MEALAIIDEQSKNTFIDQKLLSMLKIDERDTEPVSYCLTTLDRLETPVEGSKVVGISVQALDSGSTSFPLPPSYTHPHLPDASSEVAVRSQVAAQAHLRHLSHHFPESTQGLETLILIGADCGHLMKTDCQGTTFPWAHKTPLGYALVGPPADSHPDSVRCLKTKLSPNEHFQVKPAPGPSRTCPFEPDQVFIERPDDELPSLSKQDAKFTEIVSHGVRVNKKGNIEIPLPLKDNAELPDNAQAVYHRSAATLNKLKKDKTKLHECLKIVDGYLQKGHIRRLPPNGETKRTFIPVFPVFNESKGKIRLVFDSSAKHKGVSLNDCLYQGPDTNNSLIGVLLRFRQEEVAYAADVEHMFHCFSVPEDLHECQCFYWWEDNDPTKPIGVYCATVHVFGHTSSPAVATFGLRHAASLDKAPHREHARDFVRHNFYVDDGLRSDANVERAITTLRDARVILGRVNMRLHKIVSPHREVLEAFPPSEIAKDVNYIDIRESSNQSALGMIWNIHRDDFQLKCRVKPVPFTRRGVLSLIGSVYDPFNIVSPFTLQGKLIQRRILMGSHDSGFDWDAPLPQSFESEWLAWVDELKHLDSVSIPRCYKESGFGDARTIELHVFCDASEHSIGHVIYLRQISHQGVVNVAFVTASSKVAPRGTKSIPRLELCAAFNATIATSHVLEELDLSIDSVRYYTDSRVVLGYLNNQDRRFNRYVSRRIDGILGASTAAQWFYVSTHENPADLATKPTTIPNLLESNWFSGPDFLEAPGEVEANQGSDLGLSPTLLPDQLPRVTALRSKLGPTNHTYDTLLKTSKMSSLLNVTTHLFRFIFRCRQRLRGDTFSEDDLRQAAISYLVREAQKWAFPSEFKHLQSNPHGDLPGSSPLASLTPFFDESQRVLRVGGRLSSSSFSPCEVHPILLPERHPLTLAILRQEHHRTRHQGRTITAAAIRQSGYHIFHGSTVIRKFLKSCVICQKLRGTPVAPQMADLPKDRLEAIPPFLRSGVDCFGPYTVSYGKDTRRSTSRKKVWVVIFTCMYSRAVHLEVIRSMDTPTFLLALQRFEATRGRCNRLVSDHGSNFLGASTLREQEQQRSDLKRAIEVDGRSWHFIPPRAPHFAGVWERKIGSVKRVLAASLAQLHNRPLSYDEFDTLVKEAASIVNNTPMADVPNDPNEPFPPSPQMLLTLRDNISISPKEFSEEDLLHYGRKRWRRVQYVADQFWIRWKRDFVDQLTERSKWVKKSKNLQVGDVVLIKEVSPRNQWPMAVVHEVHPSNDGAVRHVTLRLPPLQDGKIRYRERAVHYLIPLPSQCIWLHD